VCFDFCYPFFSETFLVLRRTERDIITNVLYVGIHVMYLLKGKTIPLEAWKGPEGPRRLRLPDFKTIGT